jgi:hypothetical protein
VNERAQELHRTAKALLTKRVEVVYIDGTQVFGQLHEGTAGIVINPVAESRPGDWLEPMVLDFEAIKAIIPAEAG